MPKFDGTGPQGQGPRTGRGAGPCGGGLGQGRGCGFGKGLGRRQFLTKQEETKVLTDELQDLEAEMKAVKERLTELK